MKSLILSFQKFFLHPMSDLVSIQDINTLRQLQLELLNYNGNFKELSDFILNTIYSKTSEGMALVIHEIFTASMCNIKFDYGLIDLLKILFEKSKIPLKEIILDEAMSSQPICVKKQYLFILKMLLKKNLYTLSDIEDFSANYRHCSREELFIVFYTFAPDLCVTKSDVYQIYFEKFIHRFMFNAFDVILVDFENYAKDNWERMERMLSQQVEIDSIQYALSEDNVEELQIFCSKPCFDINKQLFYSIFSPHEMLSSASPIEIAAFFGSIKCFKYLLVNGANLNERLSHYSIAGGNLEIVRIYSQQQGSNISEAFETAVKFRRVEIFDWLVSNFSITSDQHATALCQSAEWDNAICVNNIIEIYTGHDNEQRKKNIEAAARKALERNHKCIGMYLAAKATDY